MLNRRISIYPKDIQLITGKSERTSRSIFKKIRISFNKKKGQIVTVKELSEYLGISEEYVLQILI